MNDVAYGYLRVSTDEQVEGASLDTQEDAILKYANENNIKLKNLYVDKGISAKTANRPELQKMLADIRKKDDVNCVIVYNLSRISRSVDSFIRDIGHIFIANGVRLHSTLEPIDETPTGKMLQTIFLAVHQLDNDVKSQTTMDNMKKIAMNGYWQSKAPLGYRTIKVKSGTEAKARTTLLANTDQNESFKVATVLNEFSKGYMKPVELTEYANEVGLKTEKGKKLSLNSLIKMLKSPVYAGYIQNKFTDGELVKGQHEGLIELDVFVKNNSILSNGSSSKMIKISPTRNEYPLKGILRCAHCNKMVTASAPLSGGGKSHSPRYHCYRHSGTGGSVKPEIVHRAFIKLLNEVTPSDQIIKLYSTITKRVARKELGNVTKAISHTNEQLESFAIKKQKMLDLFIDGSVTRDEKDSYLASLDAERVLLDEKLTELKDRQKINEASIEFVINYMRKPSKLWETASPELRARFQEFVFTDGLTWDWKSSSFGTLGLSPLYRYAPNKKDLSSSEKSLMVTHIESKWNLIIEEVHKWHQLIREPTEAVYIPG